jgi:hypothetical protein
MKIGGNFTKSVWVYEESIDYEGIFNYTLFDYKEDALAHLKKKCEVNGDVKEEVNYRNGMGDSRVIEVEII